VKVGKTVVMVERSLPRTETLRPHSGLPVEVLALGTGVTGVLPSESRTEHGISWAMHPEQERELIRLVKTASLEKSAALPADEIKSAAATLERNPAIDSPVDQCELASGVRLGFAMGGAGAGKSTVLAPLGHRHDIHEHDVCQNIDENLSRLPQ
jgi:hypothetical protein